MPPFTVQDIVRASQGALVAGDLGLTAGLRTAVLADWRNQAPKRLPELQELCTERADRQGELQYLLEPDLKEARGGLRDATALRAVAASTRGRSRIPMRRASGTRPGAFSSSKCVASACTMRARCSRRRRNA